MLLSVKIQMRKVRGTLEKLRMKILRDKQGEVSVFIGGFWVCLFVF